MKVVHFIGFKGEEYLRAVRVFGEPDMVHRYADNRFFGDVEPNDVCIFANGEELNIERRAHKPSFNDSMHF